MSISTLPRHPVLSDAFAEEYDSDVILIDAIPVSPGDQLALEFEENCSEWRQGVWLGVDGKMEVAGTESSSMQIWEDNSPSTVNIRIIESNGFLHLYNIWDRGHGTSSQAHTSGMIVEEFGRSRRYRCQAISTRPSFNDMTFRIDRIS